jgi:hypothetical protein
MSDWQKINIEVKCYYNGDEALVIIPVYDQNHMDVNRFIVIRDDAYGSNIFLRNPLDNSVDALRYGMHDILTDDQILVKYGIDLAL